VPTATPKLVASSAGDSLTVSVSSSEIDEYGELSRWLKDNQDKLARHESLGRKIRAALSDYPADQIKILVGERWKVQASEKQIQRTFDLKAKLKLWKKFGKKAIEFFNPSLKSCEEEFGKNFVDSIATQERTGFRKLSAFPADSL
jgi:hypothetical protein